MYSTHWLLLSCEHSSILGTNVSIMRIFPLWPNFKGGESQGSHLETSPDLQQQNILNWVNVHRIRVCMCFSHHGGRRRVCTLTCANKPLRQIWEDVFWGRQGTACDRQSAPPPHHLCLRPKWLLKAGHGSFQLGGGKGVYYQHQQILFASTLLATTLLYYL